jgi:hypothetical protein
MRHRLTMPARACVAAVVLGLAAGCASSPAAEKRYSETIATGAAAGAIVGGILGAITGAVVPGSDIAIQGAFIGIASGLAAGVAAGIVIAERNEVFAGRETKAESRRKAAEAEAAAWEKRAVEAEREAAVSARDVLRLRELHAARKAAAGDLAAVLTRLRNDLAQRRIDEREVLARGAASAAAGEAANVAQFTAAAERLGRTARQLEAALAGVPPA